MTTPYTAPKPNLPKAPRSRLQDIIATVILILALWLLWDSGLNRSSQIYHMAGALLFGFAGLGLAVYLWTHNGGEQ